METRESKELKFTKFEKYFYKIHFLGKNIAELHNTAAETNNQNVTKICLEQSILKSSEFIHAYEKFEKYVPENKKDLFEKFRPFFCVLLEYKIGLKRYRNKRIAHIDELDTSSMDIFIDGKLPTSILEFEALFEIIEVLTLLVDSLFYEYIPDMIKKLQNQINNMKQIPRRDFEKKFRTAKNEVWSKIKEDESHLPGFTTIKTKLLD